MSVLAGIIGKQGQDVSPVLLKMIRSSSPIKGDTYGFATSALVEIHYQLPKYLSFKSTALTAHKLIKIDYRDSPQPIQLSTGTLTSIGRLWDDLDPQILQFYKKLEGQTLAGLKELLESSGQWISAVLEEESLLIGRDPSGLIPLYFGEGSDIIGIASNQKMLYEIGLEAISVKPGSIVKITKSGTRTLAFKPILNPSIKQVPMDVAVTRFHQLLTTAVQRRCRGIINPTIAFSGGIDSTVLASIIKNSGVKPHLICVGFEGSPDFEAAESSAEALKLPLTIHMITPDEFEESLPNILRSIEEPDPMKVGVATPLFFATKLSQRKVIFSGNGSDELFGGYAKYSRLYALGPEVVKEAIFKDTIESYRVNYERDWKICSDLGTELRLPYADLDLIKWALTIPIELKLSKNENDPRKKLLRSLAKELNLPSNISERLKKSAQYSTGTMKTLEKLAKKNNVSVKDYLIEAFMEANKNVCR